MDCSRNEIKIIIAIYYLVRRRKDRPLSSFWDGNGFFTVLELVAAEPATTLLYVVDFLSIPRPPEEEVALDFPYESLFNRSMKTKFSHSAPMSFRLSGGLKFAMIALRIPTS